MTEKKNRISIGGSTPQALEKQIKRLEADGYKMLWKETVKNLWGVKTHVAFMALDLEPQDG